MGLGKQTVEYDQKTKRFWVRVNSGQRYEKEKLDDLTRELSRMGVPWKLSRAAKKQVAPFNPNK